MKSQFHKLHQTRYSRRASGEDDLTKMAIRRIRIDYTVYLPDHHSGEPCWDFRTFTRAKSAARSFGVGARIYRNFNQTNKRNKVLGGWWGDKYFWTWSGKRFERVFDTKGLRRDR